MSKKQYCALYWLIDANWLSTVHEWKNINSKSVNILLVRYRLTTKNGVTVLIKQIFIYRMIQKMD